MKVESYLFFNGRCEEAIDYYKRALDAEVVMMLRFKDSPEPPQPGMLAPGSENKIMHATVRIGETNVMASDGDGRGATKFDGFGLALEVRDAAEAKRRFDALADGRLVPLNAVAKSSPVSALVAETLAPATGWSSTPWVTDPLITP